MIKYDYYNREERAICAHLFRLLHERLDEKEDSPLGQFLAKLNKSGLQYNTGQRSLDNLKFENVAIYSEVAIIRDTYQNAKPDVNPFMDDLTRLIMDQIGVTDCRLFSQLPEPLNNSKKTHPKQIKQKATAMDIPLNESESRVYGSMQGMFNAKPDMVITIDKFLLVCEAKLTESFDDAQLHRTRNIAQVWARLLYEDLGFSEPPVYTVFKLGAATEKPDIRWTDVLEIAEITYGENDRSRIAIQAAVDLLIRYPVKKWNEPFSL